jgi:hypothetical protein
MLIQIRSRSSQVVLSVHNMRQPRGGCCEIVRERREQSWFLHRLHRRSACVWLAINGPAAHGRRLDMDFRRVLF